MALSLDDGSSQLLAALLLLATLAFFVVRYYLHLLSTKKPFPDLPMSSGNHWLFGHVKLLFDADAFPQSLYTVCRDSANEHGLTGYWFGNKRVISTLKVEDSRLVLLRESNRENIPIISRYIALIIGTKSLIRLNGREWKLHRDAVTKTFVPSFLIHSQKDVQEVARNLTKSMLQKIEEQQNDNKHNHSTSWEVDDIHPVMKFVTLDVIGKSGFGVDFDCCKTLKATPVVESFDFLGKDMSVRLKSPASPWNLFPNIFPTKQNKLYLQHCKVLRGFVAELLGQAQKKLTSDAPADATTNGSNNNINGSSNNNKQQNLLTRLVAVHEVNKANGVDDAKALDEALSDVMCTLLFASYDTTSTTLTLALSLLSTHPDIQERCVEEVQSLLQHGSDLCNADELWYCTAVIKETLRLYPVAFTIARTLTKPLQLSGCYDVPVGTHMNVPVYLIQRNPDIFPKPEECHPERWAERVATTGSDPNKSNGQLWAERDYEKEAANNDSIPAGNPDAFMAFSIGGRSCPGAKFALQEATLVLANLLKDLKVLPVPGFQLKVGLQGVLPYPKGGVKLRFEKR